MSTRIRRARREDSAAIGRVHVETWQATYAEYVSVAPLWPDFDVVSYHAALHEFQRRERRFGGV